MHHGNGVEEGFKPFSNLFYGSTHEKDNYPGTGLEPINIGDAAESELDRRIVNRTLATGKNSKGEFRVKWAQIMHEMLRFQPELVIISAGFDAHKDDPLGGCALQEEDFAWATQAVLDVCSKLDPVNPVPCISVLEGGYNVKAIAECAAVHCATMKNWAESYNRVAQKQSDLGSAQNVAGGFWAGEDPSCSTESVTIPFDIETPVHIFNSINLDADIVEVLKGSLEELSISTDVAIASDPQARDDLPASGIDCDLHQCDSFDNVSEEKIPNYLQNLS